ncbi:disease resistance protein RPM1-like [Vitis riparia]|uniref:disease resistance protein RPM1-like n=1 Tax=Vitis riparia TaxID=96939 RepID=UPI00155A930B|nr:disease resistance protein RPM1-like [Vitis riparia]
MDADAKREKADVSQGLKTWIQDLRETAYSIEDVIDEYLLHLGNPSQRHRFIGFLYKVGRLIKKLKRRREVASKIRDIQKKVLKLKETSSTHGFITSVQPGSGGRSTSAPWHGPRPAGGGNSKTDCNVVGMGGLGKTTLANKIYENKVLVGHFDCSAWITVSQSFKMEELLRNMSMKFYQARKEPVPEGINTMDESSLMTLTRQYLQDKRYVVVFDDVWKLDFWGFIKYVLPENKKGSRIIITTRNDEVASCCKESSFDYIHKLQPLPPKSSWELFCKKAFQGGCPPELEKLSHDIIRRCGGLPLAIVAIGGLLSRKEKLVSEWQKFNDTIGCELQSNSHLESINTILSLSYHDLPYYLKSCFLYLAIFPEDYTISCRLLTRLWIAEGFVKPKRGVTLEEVAEEFLTELIHRSLVQVSEVYGDGKIKTCHVHDLMREIILTKAEELSFCCVMGEETSSFDGRFRRLSVHNSPNKVANITGKKSYIRSIFLYDSQTFFLGTLASRFNLLKVLDSKPSHGRIKQAQSQLKLITKGSDSVTSFMQSIKAKADELALLGALLNAEDLIDKTLDGLGDEYRELTRAVQARDMPITFKELHEKLLNFEASVITPKPNPLQFPTIANPTSRNPTPRRSPTPSGTTNHTWRASNSHQHRYPLTQTNDQPTPQGSRPFQPYLGYCQIYRI